MIEFRLPWPPTLGKYYRCIHGKMIRSKAGRIYRDKVIELIDRYDMAYGIETEVGMLIKLAPPMNGIFDADNYNKAILDSLTHAGFWKDDSQVGDLRVVKLPKYAMGEVYIEVWEI